jgi:HAD superfamily hydrolase (TIGR01549 family)
LIRRLIFDVDGTLIDSKVDIADAQLWVLRQLGVERWRREDIYPRIGRPLTETFKELLPPEMHDRITEAKRMYIAHYRPRALDTTTLFPGVEETLAALHARRIPIAVATTKSSVTANRVLEHFGIRKYFVQVQGTDDSPAKPDPYVVNQILLKQGWKANETALVGDSEVDIQCAHNAGIQAWAVTWGSTPEARAIELGADRIVRTMPELLEGSKNTDDTEDER